MSQFRLLIADDDPLLCSALARVLRTLDCAVTTANDGLQALSILDEQGADAALVDLLMPRMDGLQFLKRALQRAPELQVIMLTGHGSVPSAVEAMRLGAVDFIEKPAPPEAVRRRVQAAYRVWDSRRSAAPGTAARLSGGASLLVGESVPMRELRRLARRLGDRDVTVLIQGESGTGKEQFAREVHHSGNRAHAPFIAIDIPSLGESMVEGELFGHVKGAYTGADSDRDGLICAAGQGTVFLDEIGDISTRMQMKFLRVLQEKEVRPVGSDRARPIEARFIVATNRDLALAVDAGTFRTDLFYRLDVVTVTIPPLRDRRADIALLAENFRRKYVSERSNVTGIGTDALQALASHDWPGNVRELENVVLRAMVTGCSEVITLADLPPHITRLPESDVVEAMDESSLAAIERETILQVLSRADGNRRAAARLLGISESTLYRRLRRYGF